MVDLSARGETMMKQKDNEGGYSQLGMVSQRKNSGRQQTAAINNGKK